MIQKLILLSPVGLSSNYAEVVSTKIEDFAQTLLFKFKPYPSFGYKAFGFIANSLFDYVCANKCNGFTSKVNIISNLLE